MVLASPEAVEYVAQAAARVLLGADERPARIAIATRKHFNLGCFLAEYKALWKVAICLRFYMIL